jgi:hypothetical protein
VRVLLLLREGVRRHGNVFVAVQVVKLCGDGVGVVRVRHGYRQAEGLVRCVAHMVVHILARLEDGFLVMVELVGAHAGAGLQHGGHIVVPARPHLEFVPVHGPAVVGRIDVGGEPLFIAVQLIRAAEVHLAGQGRAVAQVAQVVGVGGNVGGKVGGIVIGADLRGQLAADQAEARGGAQGAGAVGRFEHHAFGRQFAQVRHLHHRLGVVHGQHGCGHLVGHDEQDVGAFAVRSVGGHGRGLSVGGQCANGSAAGSATEPDRTASALAALVWLRRWLA